MAPEAHSEALGKANAYPTKAFFVRMLTRDISLDACILDLIDNAVDAAWRTANGMPTTFKTGNTLDKYEVQLNIDVSGKQFRILDNCGGISLDDAAAYAFTFGRDEEQATGDFAVGVYGIGMKRAIFKLGTQIRVRSTHSDDPPFSVPIDVDAWMGSRIQDMGF